jgi:RNA polymerase sigma-70 factor (ECF subfamily)
MGEVGAMSEEIASVELAGILESYRAYLGAIAAASLGPDLRAKVGRSDLVQETFLAAGRDARSFRGETEEDLKAWLRGILRHLISNTRQHFRGVERRRIDREIPLGAYDVELEDPATSIMTRQLREERDEELAKAIARLPESHRLILERHIRDGWTFARIGHELGISEGAARKQWARALLRLRRDLESEP